MAKDAEVTEADKTAHALHDYYVSQNTALKAKLAASTLSDDLSSLNIKMMSASQKLTDVLKAETDAVGGL